MVHAAAQGDASGTLEHVHELWGEILDSSTDFGTKLDRLLASESEQFGLQYGHLTHIDVTAETQEIVAAHGGHERIQPGDACRLSESYCRKTIVQPDGTYRVNDAVAEGWAEDPAYELFELGSYVGATVETTGDLFGTLCFASSDPRDEPITDAEVVLVDMLARWAGFELSVRSARRDLDERADRTAELAAAAAHDLRSPLSVAVVQIGLLNDSFEEAIGRIRRAHSRMDRIVENLDALTRLDQPVTDPDTVDLRSAATAAWTMVETGDATLETDLDGVRIEADRSRLDRLFENLFRNAVEHGSTGSQNASRSDDAVEHGSTSPPSGAREDAADHAGEAVSVRVGRLPDGFYVEDDGPGIPKLDREAVFEPGYSTASDGTGLGLSIVRAIAAAHGWTVAIVEGPDGGMRLEVTDVGVGVDVD